MSGRRDRTCGFDNPLVTSCVSDAQNCGKTQIFHVADAQNCGKTQIFHVADRPFRHFVRVGRSKCKFWSSPSDPFVTSAVVKCKFISCPERPFRHFGRDGRSNLWQNANSCTWPSDPFVTSDVSGAQNCGKMQILDLAEQPFFGQAAQLQTYKLTYNLTYNWLT